MARGRVADEPGPRLVTKRRRIKKYSRWRARLFDRALAPGLTWAQQSEAFAKMNRVTTLLNKAIVPGWDD